jgi:hypothetical protein
MDIGQNHDLMIPLACLGLYGGCTTDQDKGRRHQEEADVSPDRTSPTLESFHHDDPPLFIPSSLMTHAAPIIMGLLLLS